MILKKKRNVIITYDEEGNQTGYRTETCESGGIFSDCKCFPPASGPAWYSWAYDESGHSLEYRGCVERIDGDCSGYTIGQNIWDENGRRLKETKTNSICSTAWDGTEGTCPSFASGYEGSTTRRDVNDPNGPLGVQTRYECGTFNADGSCKTYKVNLDASVGNIRTYYNLDGTPVYGTPNGFKCYWYEAYCTSFSGKTCTSWKTRLKYGEQQTVGTATSGWSTCTTLKANGSC